jgi:hypothetical protein
LLAIRKRRKTEQRFNRSLSRAQRTPSHENGGHSFDRRVIAE